MTTMEFVHPERFVAGTVGEPGSREFYLQARGDRRVEGVKIEKAQVALLTERVEELLDEVGADQDMLPARPDNDPLELPVDPNFIVGNMSAAWDPAAKTITLEFHSIDPDGSDASGEHSLRVVLTAPLACEFVRRSYALVAQGRQPCPLCGEPLNPEGHVCPRANGYRRR